MIQRTDPDNFSIRIPIRGRAALIRNTVIGAVIGAALMPEIATFAPMGKMLLITLFGGGAAGAFSMLTAWLGQIAALQPESRQRITYRAILSAGLIGAAIGIIGVAYVILLNEAESLAGNFAPISAFISVFFGLLSGAGLGAVLTSAIAIVLMLTPPQSSTVGAAPHLLNQAPFDPLHHVEDISEHVRR